jgi:transcriptional regulator of acetoin/glycerol metabolism
VAGVLATLPDDLRDLAERLKRQSVSEVARELRVPRTTLYRNLERLRRHFADAHLRDYL